MKINVLLPLRVYQFILAYFDIKVSSVFIQTAAVYFILVISNRICPVMADMLNFLDIVPAATVYSGLLPTVSSRISHAFCNDSKTGLNLCYLYISKARDKAWFVH